MTYTQMRIGRGFAQDVIERALGSGTATRADLGIGRPGINGPLDGFLFADPITGAQVPGVVKPVAAGGAHEVLGYEGAAALGVDHLFATTARRSNGDAAIEFAPGRSFHEVGARSSRALESLLTSGYVDAHKMSEADAAHTARVDRQLMQAYDAIMGQRDRHAGNGLYDVETGRMTLIDQGMIGSFRKRLVPMQSTYSNGEGVRLLKQRVPGPVELTLDQDVRDVLARADRDALATALDRFASSLPANGPIGHHGARPDGTWLPRMLDMLDHAVEDGTVRWYART